MAAETKKGREGDREKNDLKNGSDSYKFVFYDFAHSSVLCPWMLLKMIAFRLSCIFDSSDIIYESLEYHFS